MKAVLYKLVSNEWESKEAVWVYAKSDDGDAGASAGITAGCQADSEAEQEAHGAIVLRLQLPKGSAADVELSIKKDIEALAASYSIIGQTRLTHILSQRQARPAEIRAELLPFDRVAWILGSYIPVYIDGAESTEELQR